MSEDPLVYRIALSNLPGVGDINARKLIHFLGGEEAIFSESHRGLVKIPGIGSRIATHIYENRSLDRARREAEFIAKNNIGTAWFKDDNYPARLNECPDSPVLLYYKGLMHGEAQKVMSVIGTRNATRRGKEICKSIISALAADHNDLVIVSGLAYGIDITAHKAALENGIATVGVMAHGFATLYPSVHTGVAREMLMTGGLLTDFLSDEPPDRNNFLKRNRIIAGLADATLVVESGSRGGAMVTADIAVSYSREVFAVPGTPGDKYSEGSNLLIKSDKARLVENGADIEYFMGWEKGEKRATQPDLFKELSPLEKDIFNLLSEHIYLSPDSIGELLEVPVHRLSSALLGLQFAGHITALPGNIYRINSNV